MHRIAGKFHWCKFLYIWPKTPQNKFSYVLISYARAARDHAHVAYLSLMWHCMTIFLQVCTKHFSLYYNQMILTGLWVDHSKTWQNTGGYLAKRFNMAACHVWGQGSLIKFLIFVVFIFAYRALVRNIQKFAPYENFPLYGMCLFQNIHYMQEFIMCQGKRVLHALYTLCNKSLESNVTSCHEHITKPGS